MRTRTAVVRILPASIGLLIALNAQVQALTIIQATLSRGTVTVSGSQAAISTNISWEGNVVAVSSRRGTFAFATTIVPARCVGTLSDGVSTIGVAIGGCTEEPPSPPTAVLATGQTRCWDAVGKAIACVGTGQDGALKAGIGLKYTSNDNGTITDNNTGLIWEKKTIANMFDVYTWGEAFDYVAALNASNFAGYRDWRLPNVRELQTIIDYENFGPAVSPEFDDCDNGSCTVAAAYWSSTSVVAAPDLAWRVSFWDGFQLVGGKGFGMRVRAVRGG